MRLSRPESCRNATRKPDFQPGTNTTVCVRTRVLRRLNSFRIHPNSGPSGPAGPEGPVCVWRQVRFRRRSLTTVVTQPGKLKNRPRSRPKAGRRADFEVFPTRILPKCDPETRFPARDQYDRLCQKSPSSMPKPLQNPPQQWSLRAGRTSLCVDSSVKRRSLTTVVT